jgi:hypothetical protein
VVESTALEMRRTGNRTGGSNPSLSASRLPLPSSEVPRGSQGNQRRGFLVHGALGSGLLVRGLLAIESFKRTIIHAHNGSLREELPLRNPQAASLPGGRHYKGLGKPIGLEETAAMT